MEARVPGMGIEHQLGRRVYKNRTSLVAIAVAFSFIMKALVSRFLSQFLHACVPQASVFVLAGVWFASSSGPSLFILLL